MEYDVNGAWVYMMTNRYRGTLYVGSTADLASRIVLHRGGKGSEFCAKHGLTRLVWAECLSTMQEALDHEKRLKRWHRQWKIELVEKANTDWDDLFDRMLS